MHFFPKFFNSLCTFSIVFLDRFDFKTASQRGEWTQQHSATQEIIFSPMKELMNILFEITEKIDGRTWKQKNIRENKMTSTSCLFTFRNIFCKYVISQKRTVKTYQALAPPGALVAKPSNQHKSAPGGAAIVSVHLPGVDGNDGGSQDI